MTRNETTSILVIVSLAYQECIIITIIVIAWESLFLWIKIAFIVCNRKLIKARLRNPQFARTSWTQAASETRFPIQCDRLTWLLLIRSGASITILSPSTFVALSSL